MKTITLLFINSLFINGVFCEKNETVRVSVNEGDSVTLHTHVTELKGDDVILWRFKVDLIAKVNRAVKSDPVYEPDERFTDRLKMNPQTGDLTITNITSELTGDYKQENINGKTEQQLFSVRLSPKVKMVKERDSVSLHINVTDEKRNEKIHWKIKHNNSPVANITIEAGKISTSFIEERFRDRLKLDDQTGDLIITHMKNEDSGQYEADVTIGHTHTIHKTFSFTDSEVSERFISGDGQDVRSSRGLSPGEIVGICVAAAAVVVGVVVGGVVIYRRRKMRHQVSNTGQKATDTNDSLMDGETPV